MNEEEENIIRRAYAEASLAAREKGLSGLRAQKAVLAAAAKVSSRLLGRIVEEQDILVAMH